MAEHLIYLLVMFLGHFAHVLKSVIEVRNNDQTMTLKQYVMMRPYKTMLALCGSIVGYLMLYDTGQLTLVAAMGVGYMADSVFEVTESRVKDKL